MANFVLFCKLTKR